MASSPTSLQFQVAPPFPTASKSTPPSISLRFKTLRVIRHSTISLKLPKSITRTTKPLIFVSKAIEENRESAESETTIAQESPESATESGAELSELGAEIKKAMNERRGEEEGGLWSGVAEEIREIEWPAFGKVLGTTGVVLGVIVGSSVVLLTLNAVLAELSDRVFAGKGVQDFFG